MKTKTAVLMYRRKSPKVEAFQLTRERMDDNTDWPQWLHAAWNTPKEETGAVFLDPEYHEGTIDRDDAFRFTIFGGSSADDRIFETIAAGDWFVYAHGSELGLYSPEVFEEAFEPA